MTDKQTVKFGDICREVKLTTKDPIADGYERYIGLEHLDSGSLKIKRWGIIEEDNPSFTRVFKKGHILFGKRRPYLKKAAIAEFDGICSGDILVLEPKHDGVTSDYLSRIIHTERFWNWAIKTSSGSLSPRTKFSVLKELAVDVVEKEKQRVATDVLDLIDEKYLLKENLLNSAETLFKVVLINEIWKPKSSWKEFSIGELGEVKLGRQRTPKYTTGKYSKPYLRVVNVLDGELDLNDVEEMDFNDSDFETHQLKTKDILITEGDITSVFNVGRVAMYNDEIESCCIQNTLLRFRSGPLILPEFALYLFRCAFYKGIFAYAANMTTVAHLGAGRFSAIKVSIPPIERQKEIVDKVIVADKLVKNLKADLANQQEFKKVLSAEFMETK
ncbi:restriction endonuclease subunit S [Gynuella sunshinyii]|uniref:Restriction endonuclease S subunit n=1 Tax=Gynuella sunshinyii YC6258 TaxID=1445510 RepID=A0A0C5VFI8_9GAMM|nr:restriction endonuclease subunit S [Gynuella sunshinyii]AJQ92153.1 restriction endonuclease S subunit [Gynuella sunshinyii YC6258]